MDKIKELEKKVESFFAELSKDIKEIATGDQITLNPIPFDDPRVKFTDYFVESEEYHLVWQQFNSSKEVFQWEQDSGVGTQIASFAGCPIWISLHWVLVNGNFICFYYPTSEVIHWKLVEDWIKNVFDKSTRLSAQNVYNMAVTSQGKWKSLEEIRRAIGGF